MISVRNHQQQLSGSKRFLTLIGLCFLAACSPKSLPVKTSTTQESSKKSTLETSTSTVNQKTKVEQPEMVVSLILPFELNTYNYQTVTLKQLGKAEMPLDFYQGFKLALDSVANNYGANFKLQVFDSKDNLAVVAGIGQKEEIKKSDLIVGPVFPNEIKTFSTYSKSLQKLTISPLAATAPETFNNPYLVTISNSLDQHVQKMASFIQTDLKPKKIILVRSGQVEEAKYAVPFKEEMKKISKNITFSEIGIKAVGYENVFKHLNPIGLNVVVLPSTERMFLQLITKELERLSSNFEISVVGHPNWEKLAFLDVANLQRLNSYITSSSYIDKESAEFKGFVNNYKNKFTLSPSEFAIKGFDMGYFFGKLMFEKGKNFTDFLETKKYQGLHTQIKLVKDTQFGYYNKEVLILKYEDFKLVPLK